MSRKLSMLVMAGLLLPLCTAVQGQGLKGEYFSNMALSGAPVLTRTENVNFNWGGAAPDAALGADSFSVRWTGSITPPVSTDYIFATNTDDGVRLWVAGELIIDNWSDHSATRNSSAPIALEAGKWYGIKLEFYENTGDAVVELYWAGLDEPDQIIPPEVLSPDYIETILVQARQPNPADGMIGVNAGAPLFEWTKGETAFFHNVYIGTTPELTEADRQATNWPYLYYYYAAGFTPGSTYYWRIDEVEKDIVTIHTGEVWSFMTQDVTAYCPNPADGTTDASPTQMLTWMPGDAVVKHHLYFSDNLDAVTQGTAEADKGVRELADANYLPDAPLENVATYCWRADGILLDGTVKTGPVWTFTTHLPVDDFESYNDDEGTGTRIYETWIDGWTNNNGATVGYIDPPFAEQKIVHSGRQSMPLDYNNVIEPFYSEAVREFSSAQDWTVGGVDTLVLSVRGRVFNNPALLYVTVEDASRQAATVVYPDSAVTTTSQWIDWRIPLADLADVNSTRIKKLYIGLGDRQNPAAGSAGLIFIDDIRVIKSAPPE
jgi:hypothetical protein